MEKILKEDIERIHELIYGEKLLKEDNRLINKLKDTISNIFRKKENPTAVQNPQKSQTTPKTSPLNFIKSPLSHMQPPAPRPKGPVLSNNGFTQLNLLNHKDYNTYSQICQAFINKRNPNAGINGNMMASAARNVYQSTKKYVPPELALAQLALEGGLSKNPNAKPIRTNNPFNVGHYDNGRVVPFRTKQEGINRYYELIANNYLNGGKTAAHLAQNFTNTQGNRYASAPDYESKLNQIMKEVNNISLSIISAQT